MSRLAMRTRRPARPGNAIERVRRWTTGAACASACAAALLANCEPASALVRRIDAHGIPHQTLTRALTPAERQFLASKAILQPNDPTLRTVLERHVMRAQRPSSVPLPPGAAPPANRAPTAGASGSGPDLAYFHGQVVVNPLLIPVFWGFGPVANGPLAKVMDPNGALPYLTSFFDALGGSPWLGTVDQYFQDPGSMVQHIQSSTLSVATPIFDPLPVPAHYTSTDVFNEIQRLVTAGQIGENSSDIIVVVTPHGSSNTELLAEQGCAAHYSYQSLNWFQVQHHYTYVSVPYLPDLGGSCGAGSVSGPLDGLSIVVGHEIAEAITDPYSNYDWNIDHEAGWVTSLDGGAEIGDLCAWIDVQNTFLGTGVSFPTQPLWSNQANACVQPQAPQPPRLPQPPHQIYRGPALYPPHT